MFIILPFRFTLIVTTFIVFPHCHYIQAAINLMSYIFYRTNEM